MDRPRRPNKAIRLARLQLRRAIRLADRRAEVWSRKAGSWGGSLAFHLLILLLLALLVVWRPVAREQVEVDTILGQLKDDVTSLNPADEAGDSFTRLEDEALSLPFDPNEIDPSVLNVPELPDTITFADELVKGEGIDLGDPREGRAILTPGGPSGATGLGGIGLRAPFEGRQSARKAALLRSEGGTRESEAAVERGLDWLARHQAPDGHWSLDPLPFCEVTPCPAVLSMTNDAAATGLALLPFLGAGHSPTEKGRYQKTIERGIDWLLSIQQPTGEMYTGSSVGNARLYTHAIATLAICEAYGLTGDKRLREPAERGIGFISAAQNQMDGGWRYEPGMAGDTSVFGWQMMALRSGFLAKLKIDPRTLKGAVSYLNAAATNRKRAGYAYMPGRSVSPVMTAEALLCRQYLGWKRDHPSLRTGADFVFQDLMTTRQQNIYYWYYATQMLHNLGGKDWKEWNERIRDGLVTTQAQADACDNGSWSPVSPLEDRWGRSAGRHYQTCLSILTLEVYYRYLPLYKNSAIGDSETEPEQAEGKVVAGGR